MSADIKNLKKELFNLKITKKSGTSILKIWLVNILITIQHQLV